MFSALSSSPTTSASGNGEEGDRRIIGLDVSGSLFYFRVHKLVEVSSYFGDRLSKSSNEVDYKDAQGRPILFVERSPDLFKHVRDFILMGTLTMACDLPLRRALRMEAEFFGIPAMVEMLLVSQTFAPGQTNQGVLYWLGTKRGAAPYANPHRIGAVHVGGWVDDFLGEEEEDFNDEEQREATIAGSPYSREALVHYRHCLPINTAVSSKGNPVDAYWALDTPSRVLWCDHGSKRLPAQINLQEAVALRPTHYSLRVSKCYGMQGDWNFEASQDNQEWEVLHAARNDRRLFVPSEDYIKRAVGLTLLEVSKENRTDERASDILLGVLEQDFRHTWEITPAPSKFYRYFRIIGASTSDYDGNVSEDEEGSCLHGEGLELYGEVYEE
ncbi:expressed unknown protein [Seminavis robusta]|uniref:Potassium channel tetramerisation-type BTB domain-containing protein n=1 Tax=Seminavis robusta TaxID=568900 RepID=A0A9N8DGN5_9STRA|nr:expressed unknown protein [Seminavis robusta]|eukprot:Sro82_g044080.1 n/a (385) ;mRNA; f:116326-117480